jgi:uroporphyrinogen-III synthase
VATILVTRPAEVAERTAATCRRLGHDVLLAPVSRIEPVNGPDPDLGGVQALLVTSRQAVPAVAAWRPALPIWAVGEGTADALEAAGLSVTGRGEGDGISLGRRLRAALDPAEGALLHACGTVLAEGLQRTLEDAGFVYRPHPVYTAVQAKRLPADVVRALRDGGVRAVTLHSPESARRFARLLAEAGLGEAAADCVALCLSDNVAAAARALAWRDVAIASRPDERGMGRLLEATPL